MTDKYKLIIVLLFALILRITFLNRFPIGVAHDELDYTLNAKAIWHTGHDMTGTWNWWSLKPIDIPEKAINAELASIIMSPINGLLPGSLFSARITNVIFSIIIILLAYLIAKELINKQTALLSTLILSINPWLFHFSRTSFEAIISTTFLLAGIYLFLKQNKRLILLSSIMFFLGFFTYHGNKFLLIPLILVLYLYNFNEKKYRKIRLFPIIISILITLFFLISLHSSKANNRANELIFLSPQIAIEQINKDRRLAIPSQINKIFLNKIVFYTDYVIKNYLKAYSPEMLFGYGDSGSAGALTNSIHGSFYYIDFILLIIGIIYLTSDKKYKNSSFILLSLLAIAPITGSSHIPPITFVLRASIVYPIISIIMAFGLYKITKNHKYLIPPIALFYLIFLLRFLHIYLYRYPIYQAEGFFFSDRIMAKYISLNKNQKISILSESPVSHFMQYLFYSGNYNDKKNIQALTSQFQKGEGFQINNIFFRHSCQTDSEIKNNKIIIIRTEETKCIEKIQKIRGKSHLSISDLKDTGQIYHIYGDKICEDVKLKRYPRISNFNEFDIEQMNRKQFCELWISKLD